jgi:hypothetical protein
MARMVSAVAGAFRVAAVPIDRRMPASTALMASLLVGVSNPADRCKYRTPAQRRVMVEAFKPDLASVAR